MVRSVGTEHFRPVEVLIEVNPNSTSGDLAPRAVLTEEFRQRAAEIADSVALVADQFKSRFKSVMHPPAVEPWNVGSVKIEFKVAVQAETGIVIAKASTSATFSVTLTLEPQSDES